MLKDNEAFRSFDAVIITKLFSASPNAIFLSDCLGPAWKNCSFWC